MTATKPKKKRRFPNFAPLPLDPDGAAAHALLADRGPLTPEEVGAALGLPARAALDVLTAVQATGRAYPERGKDGPTGRWWSTGRWLADNPGLVWTVAHRAAGRHASTEHREDAHQCALLSAFALARSFDPTAGATFGTYYTRYAEKYARDDLMRRRKHWRPTYLLNDIEPPSGEAATLAETLPARASDPDTNMLAADVWRVAEQVCSPAQLRVLRDVVMGGTSERDYAELCGISRAGVNFNKKAALYRLRLELQLRGVIE